jgi:tetratricopeptide (TPR) repeat protein
MIFRRNLGLAIALLLLGAIPSAQAGPREDARGPLSRAIEALDRNDPQTARVELMNAIRADPNLAEAHVAQARALLMLGSGARAQVELERAQTLGAKRGPLRHLLAHAALLQGQGEEAVRQATAADADPGELFFRTRIEALGFQVQGHMTESARAFDRALVLQPQNAMLWADIARFQIANGDMAKAFASADRALNLAPHSADALGLRALLVREQYGPEASRQLFDKALAADRKYVPVLIEYAATLADMGHAGEALSLTRRALVQAPGLPRAFFIQAVIAARAGRYDLARSLLGRTRGLLDQHAATHMLKGVLHMQANNATLAVGEFGPLLEAQPLNLRARVLLARAYYEDGQYHEAEKTLFPIVERADAGSYALTLAARIHEALGNRDLAGRFLARSVALAQGPSDVFRGADDPEQSASAANAKPAAAAANIRYIRALLHAGQEGTAAARARSLALANPGAPDAWIVLGDCLMAAHRPAEAAKAYERAADLRFRSDVALRLVDAWRLAERPDRASYVLGLFLSQNPQDIDALRLAATLMLAAKDYGRALTLLESLRARLGSEDALLMADLARTHIGAGKAEEALPFAAHAYRLMPASAVGSDIFGWALFKAGRMQPALTLLRKAAQLAPNEPVVRAHLAEAEMLRPS